MDNVDNGWIVDNVRITETRGHHGDLVSHAQAERKKKERNKKRVVLFSDVRCFFWGVVFGAFVINVVLLYQNLRSRGETGRRRFLFSDTDTETPSIGRYRWYSSDMVFFKNYSSML